jgi:hypothetical protein
MLLVLRISDTVEGATVMPRLTSEVGLGAVQLHDPDHGAVVSA